MLETVRQIRAASQIPIVLYIYYNLVHRHGVEKFVQDAAQAGVDGLLVLDLPPELEAELAAEASRNGLRLPEYVLKLVVAGRVPDAVPRTGSQLVAYWRDEGLIGNRPDIEDSQEHARALRRQAERRQRTFPILWPTEADCARALSEFAAYRLSHVKAIGSDASER